MAQYLNLPAFCDYIITNYYGGNWDWDWHNFTAIYSPPKASPGRPSCSTTGTAKACSECYIQSAATSPAATRVGDPTQLFVQLMANPDFRSMFADHVYADLQQRPLDGSQRGRHVPGGGQHGQPGDHRPSRPAGATSPGPSTRPANWTPELNWHLSSYFPVPTSDMFWRSSSAAACDHTTAENGS